MRADTAAGMERRAELILHRPFTLTAGAARRIRVEVDGHPAAFLHLGATVRVAVQPGPHLLRVRCLPLASADLPVILSPHEALRVLIFTGVLDDLEIEIAPTGQ